MAGQYVWLQSIQDAVQVLGLHLNNKHQQLDLFCTFLDHFAVSLAAGLLSCVNLCNAEAVTCVSMDSRQAAWQTTMQWLVTVRLFSLPRGK